MKATMISVLSALLLVLAAPMFAENDPIKNMAGILLEMNHFPNEVQAASLEAIMTDQSAGASVRVIANAIHNIKHQATAQDKQVLTSIAADTKQSAGVRSLAGIVINFNHQVSAFQKPQLEALLASSDANQGL